VVVLEAFAERRGLPPTLLAKYGVHLAADRPGWVAFPYPHLSGVWHTRYRKLVDDGGPRWWQPEGSRTHLYNPLRLGPDVDRVMLAEGEVDTLTLIHLGFPAVGVPGVGHVQGVFSRVFALLFDEAEVSVAFDGDQAGRRAADLLKETFPKCHLIPVPDNEDVNSWWIRDPAGLRSVLQQAA
jgi:hypothetical protein